MLKILHLEDNDNDAALICEALRDEAPGCDLTRVETRGAFMEAVDHGDWDIILADYALPSFDGISALKLAVEKRPEIPFIFVTGSLGEERAVELFKNGATDYILKDRLNRLPQAVARATRESKYARDKEAAYQKLRDSLRDKSALLQEVHHRVYNNLQIICSLLDLQADAANDSSLTSALKTSLRRIESMAMVHALLYASGNPGGIDFGEYAQSLASEVAISFGIDRTRIRLEFDIEPVYLEIDRAIPCGLILNELLSNALKYAFPGGLGGVIRISLQRREGRFRLAVEDTGVGLPEPGSPRKPKSLGLTIVETLSKQLRANMEIASSQGARFVLEFAY
jgi:two-component sensor histidine kinase/CheY-like chemotaxis protein